VTSIESHPRTPLGETDCDWVCSVAVDMPAGFAAEGLGAWTLGEIVKPGLEGVSTGIREVRSEAPGAATVCWGRERVDGVSCQYSSAVIAPPPTTERTTYSSTSARDAIIQKAPSHKTVH
jgi:hypothetical protein